MRPNYSDILNRINEDPLWWDENGVPRYEEFHPSCCVNEHACDMALLLIECMGCKTEFHVAMADQHFPRMLAGLEESIRTRIGKHSLNYGLPPNINCCEYGPFLPTRTLRVLEFWNKHYKYTNGEWSRVALYEIEFVHD